MDRGRMRLKSATCGSTKGNNDCRIYLHYKNFPETRKLSICSATSRENNIPVCDTGNARCSCAAGKALSLTVSRPSFGRGRPRYRKRPKPKERVPQNAPISRAGGDQ